MTVFRRWLQAPLVAHPVAADDPLVAAFPTIFTQHFEYVWHSLRRLGVRERDLEDVVA